jgi:hypothetical protein
VKHEVQAGPDKLRQAVEVLRARGHCKNVLRDEEGRVCLVGALCAVTGYRHATWMDFGPAVRAVVREQFPDRVSPESHPDLFWEAVQFNNHPDTTADEVIAVLEKAAARLEESVT